MAPRDPNDPKRKISIRLSPKVLNHYRPMGRGWQARLNEDLKTIMNEQIAADAAKAEKE